MTTASEAFLKQIQNGWGFNFFMWKQLPAAFWAGVRLVSADENKAVVKVPYKRMSQNPFGSTYFACLAMAAEMSTGVLALAAIQGANPSMSMLVSEVNGQFSKKATQITYFTCEDGEKVFAAVAEAISTGKAVQVDTLSIGRDAQGEEIARFRIIWSFKQRSK
ncbi:MAG: DUF4442 domain-containing protein [Bacteroidia bacterium]